MNAKILIAESGGTKTDWSLISGGSCVKQFSTPSFHPSLLSSEWIATQQKELANIFDHEIGKIQLHFYGAGCYDPHRAEEMKRALQVMGFNQVQVYSDVYAAGQAVWGDAPGWVAILGTGSVLAYWNGKQIEGLLGGYGYLLGDEGSGYYFGKLLIRKLLDGSFGEADDLILQQIGVSDKRKLIRSCYDENGKSFISNLARQTADFTGNSVIKDIHQENLQLFFENYIHEDIKRLGFVGSYASAQENTLNELSASKQIELQKVVARPIDELTKYWVERLF